MRTLTRTRFDSPKKMQNKDKSGDDKSLTELSNPLSAFYSNNTTYLAKIAILLEYSPHKMLTFTQIKNKFSVIEEDQRNAYNNIKWYLTGYKCFVKILVPGTMNRKLVYWMLDCGQITAEMVQQHFLEILHLFPRLASRLEMENPSSPPGPLNSGEPAPCSAAQIKPVVKFSGPFSIDSILKRGSTSAQAYTPTLSLPVRVEHPFQPTLRRPGTKRCFGWDTDQPLILKASVGSFPVCTGGGSTHPWATADGTATPVKRMPVYSVPSLQVPPVDATLFTSPQSSGLAYTLPALTPGVPHFW